MNRCAMYQDLPTDLQLLGPQLLIRLWELRHRCQVVQVAASHSHNLDLFHSSAALLRWVIGQRGSPRDVSHFVLCCIKLILM